MNKLKKAYWKLNRKFHKNITFFREGYLALYPDVKKSGMGAWEHYVKYGKAEGRSNGYPSKKQFDAQRYLEENPDVAESGMDAWEHYAKYGIYEGRTCAKVIKNSEKKTHSERFLQDADEIWFSIIMPTYNRAYTISKSIDSVLSQTHKKFELIIADDGSTDDTETMLRDKYAQEMKSGIIRYVKCLHQGVCKTRNAALREVKHSWIAYVDSDNYVTNDWLQIYAEAITQNPRYDCFYSKFQVIQTGRIVGKPFSYELLLEGNYIDMGVFAHHISVYRECGGFDESLARLVDWDLILRYTYQNTPIFIDRITMMYNDDRERTDRISVSASYKKAFEQVRLKHRKKSITTCITTYNQEKYIAQAIESALMQQGNIRHKIIIYDDASTDGTSAIARQYAEKYPHMITHIRNETNLGLNENLRRVFSEVETDFLAILEGDDYWLDDMRLHKMTTYLDSNLDCSMCFNALFLYNEGSMRFRTLKRQAKLPEKLSGADLIVLNSPIVNLSCCVYRKKVVTTIPEIIYSGKVSEVAVAMHGLNYGYVAFYKERLSVYRQHVKGVWSGLSKVQKMEYQIQNRKVIGAVCPSECKKINEQIIADRYNELQELKEQ